MVKQNVYDNDPGGYFSEFIQLSSRKETWYKSDFYFQNTSKEKICDQEKTQHLKSIQLTTISFVFILF